jgi:hypothetical protein
MELSFGIKKETKMDSPEIKSANPTKPGAATASPEPPQPAEEPIVLGKLFPDAQQDLDALFPDPGTKKLLQDVVRNRKQNERFVKKIIAGINAEEEEEDSP